MHSPDDSKISRETNQSLGLHIILIGTEHLKAILLTMKYRILLNTTTYLTTLFTDNKETNHRQETLWKSTSTSSIKRLVTFGN